MLPDFLLVFFLALDGGKMDVVTRVESSLTPCAAIAGAASEPSIFGKIDFFGDFAAAGDLPFVGVLADPGALTGVNAVLTWSGVAVGVVVLMGVVGLLALDAVRDPPVGTAKFGISFDSFPSSLGFLSVPRFLVVSVFVLVLFSFTGEIVKSSTCHSAILYPKS
jgi:hypothetical protein